jgi:hypothetical protein
MSLALADFLIDVSDPAQLKCYKDNSELFMLRYDLSEGDKAALRSGKAGWIRFQAKLTKDEPNMHRNHPAVVAAESAGELVEVDLMVEISNTTTDQVTETDPDSEGEPQSLFVGENGQLYRIARAA